MLYLLVLAFTINLLAPLRPLQAATNYDLIVWIHAAIDTLHSAFIANKDHFAIAIILSCISQGSHPRSSGLLLAPTRPLVEVF